MQALEAVLFSEAGPITKDQFIGIYGNDRPLGSLIRNIVGLDRRAAKEAFSDFSAKAPLTADQITFVNNVIDHLVRSGIMDPKALFEPPFTDDHHEGVSGVLSDRARDIVEVIRGINANAEAA